MTTEIQKPAAKPKFVATWLAIKIVGTSLVIVFVGMWLFKSGFQDLWKFTLAQISPHHVAEQTSDECKDLGDGFTACMKNDDN